MKLIFHLLVIPILSLCLSAPLQSSERINLAVLTFSLYNTPERTGNIFRSKIEYEFYSSNRFNILERDRLAILEKEIKLSGEKEGTSGYAIAMGKMLKSDFIVTGSISFDGVYRLSISCTDINSGVIIYSRNEEYTDENHLYDSTQRISRDIINTFDSGHDSMVAGGNYSSLEKHPPWNYTLSAGFIPGIIKLDRLLHTGFYLSAGGGRLMLDDRVYGGIVASYYHFYITDPNGFALLVPLQASVSYIVPVSDKIYIAPSLCAGPVFVYLTDGKTTNKAFETLGIFTVGSGYMISRDSSIFITLSYNSLFEKDGPVDFISLGAGICNAF